VERSEAQQLQLKSLQFLNWISMGLWKSVITRILHGRRRKKNEILICCCIDAAISCRLEFQFFKCKWLFTSNLDGRERSLFIMEKILKFLLTSLLETWSPLIWIRLLQSSFPLAPDLLLLSILTNRQPRATINNNLQHLFGASNYHFTFATKIELQH